MQDPPSNPPPRDARSSTGLDTNLASALCYLLGVISAIAFLVLEKDDDDVRFHAYQSLATFGGLLVVSVAASLVPLVGGLVTLLVSPLSLILWIVLMVKAFQGGERFKLPVVGEWAEDQVSH